MASSSTGFKKVSDIDHPPLILPTPTTVGLSAKWIKKLTVVCLSTIAYTRNLFEERDFTTKSFHGQNVKVIKGTPHNGEGAQCLSKWIMGAFDAMEKRYLKTLNFEIKDETGSLLETYNFYYTYEGNQCSMESAEISVPGETTKLDIQNKKDIQNLLRNLAVATSVQPSLPLNSCTSMRINYYDDVTPADYEPPGFRPFSGDLPENEYTDMIKWTVGKVSSKFHTMIVKTRIRQPQSQPNPSEHDVFGGVLCLCGLEDSCGGLIKCETCGTLQHLACYKIFSEEDSQSQRSHKCMKCKGSKPPKDFDAVACLFRRVLILCAKSKSVSIKKVMDELHISPDSALVHIKRLQREGALQKSVEPISLERPNFMYTINSNEIIKFKLKYFNCQ